MRKHKKQQQQKQEPVINDDERNSNPIFNIVYKRIRNLNKKLANIDELGKQDPSTLKPQQLRKVKSRNEVIGEIQKN